MENMSATQPPSHPAIILQKSKSCQGFQDLFSSIDSKEKGFLTRMQILAPCQESGLSLKDPRIISIIDNINKLENPNQITLEQFAFVVGHNLQLIQKVLKGDLVIPEFQEFCEDVELIFHKTKPKLAKKELNAVIKRRD